MGQNYFNTLPLRLQLEELGKCRFMGSEEFANGCDYLKGKKIVIVGCGAQGLNQGLTLSDVAPAAPPELVAVCERAMARDPEARYPDMESLTNDVRAWLEGRVVQAYRTGVVVEVRKWFGRNRALASSVLLVLA